jgi:hypothetical protein
MGANFMAAEAGNTFVKVCMGLFIFIKSYNLGRANSFAISAGNAFVIVKFRL